MQIKNIISQCSEYIILTALLLSFIFIIRYILYKPKDRILYTKFLNIKIQYDFRIFIMLFSLYFTIKRIFIFSNIVIGVYASAMVWGFVEVIGTFLKDCATYESEKEKFYPAMFKKLGDIKDIIKENLDNINYGKIREKLSDIYEHIINSQHEFSIFILSDEYLGIHNYISTLLEDFDTFYEDSYEELNKIIIIESKKEIDNRELDKELKIEKLNNIILPTFGMDKIYKFCGVRAGNEGDILNRISIGVPKSIKHQCTFKPIFDIDKYANSNNKCTYAQVFKILFVLKWFK